MREVTGLAAKIIRKCINFLQILAFFVKIYLDCLDEVFKNRENIMIFKIESAMEVYRNYYYIFFLLLAM